MLHDLVPADGGRSTLELLRGAIDEVAASPAGATLPEIELVTEIAEGHPGGTPEATAAGLHRLADSDVLGVLAPASVDATVEKVAVNAAMAGVAAPAFGYVVAALEAILAPPFNWSALAATTCSQSLALRQLQ